MKRALFRLQYEVDSGRPYTERGNADGARLNLDDVVDPVVRDTLEEIQRRDYRDTMQYINTLQAVEGVLNLPLTTRTPEAVDYRMSGKEISLVIVSRPLHTIEKLDGFVDSVSRNLEKGGYVWCHTMTSALKRKLIEQQYPKVVARAVLVANYLWHRVCPKLVLTHKLYFAITHGKNRMMGRPEVIGRLCRGGFEVVDEQFRGGEFFLVGRKVTEPVDDTPPSGSPLIHLRRVGKGGRDIVVHKMRTMYTYSEYVQPYIYHYQSLDRGGKFRNDYRVTYWGRLLRRTWLDELPMLWNLARGDIKLVGVRPLSRHYFGLYSKEHQELRTRTKPGLLPPFYYERETPVTVEDVEESERRYLEAYFEHPFRTDWRYFWGIVGNIIFRRRRSR